MFLKNDLPENIWSEILNSKKIVSSLHTAPDTDSVATNLALAYILKKLGKDITILSSDDIPSYIKTTMDTSEIKIQHDIANYDFSNTDSIVSFDSDSLKRLTYNSNFIRPKNIKIINIDHHLTNTYFGDFNYVVPELASSCSVLFTILRHNNIEIDIPMGTFLLFGILGDTAMLNQSNTSAKDLRIVADLMDMGVDFHKMVRQLTYNEDYDWMKVKSIIYKNVTHIKDKKYAYSTVSLAEKKTLGVLEDQKFPTASDMIKQLKDVDFVFTISEKKKGTYTISFRTHKPDQDSSLFAKLFNGGGHKNSAAALLENFDSMESVVSYVTVKLDHFLSDSQKVHN